MPNITDRLIYHVFFTPHRYPVNRYQKDLLERADSFTISVQQKNIRCWKWGKGPAIVFVHGWDGRGIQFSYYIEPLIRQGYSVITFDAPAHGASQGKSTNYFEITDAIRTLDKYLHNENIYAFAGHSMGAAALLNFVSKENYKGKIILFSPPLKLKELLFQTFDRYGIPKQIYQNMIQDLEAKYGYNLFYDNPARLIKKLDQPVFIIHDLHDRMAPFSDSAHCAQRLANIQLHTTTGLGHKRILEDKSVRDIFLNFLRKNERGVKEVSKAS